MANDFHDPYFLEHHGILGMKWGHRKNRASNNKTLSSNFYNKKLNKEKEDYKEREIKAKAEAYKNATPEFTVSGGRVVRSGHGSSKHRVKASKLNDDELQATVRRMSLEKQYRDLTASEKAAGESNISKTLKKIGQDSFTTVATKAVVKGLSNAMGLNDTPKKKDE